jgi:hypothetical protein
MHIKQRLKRRSWYCLIRGHVRRLFKQFVTDNGYSDKEFVLAELEYATGVMVNFELPLRV